LICDARIFTNSISEGSSFDDFRMNISKASIARYAPGEAF